MESITSSLLAGGSLQLAFWTGLSGTALLLLVGLRRRLKAGGAPRARRPRRAERSAPTPEAGPARLRVQSAYAAQGAPAAPISPSSAAISLPMTPGAAAPALQCPADLSRRIDRLEANVRARRAGSHG